MAKSKTKPQIELKKPAASVKVYDPKLIRDATNLGESVMLSASQLEARRARVLKGIVREAVANEGLHKLIHGPNIFTEVPKSIYVDAEGHAVLSKVGARAPIEVTRNRFETAPLRELIRREQVKRRERGLKPNRFKSTDRAYVPDVRI